MSAGKITAEMTTAIRVVLTSKPKDLATPETTPPIFLSVGSRDTRTCHHGTLGAAGGGCGGGNDCAGSSGSAVASSSFIGSSMVAVSLVMSIRIVHSSHAGIGERPLTDPETTLSHTGNVQGHTPTAIRDQRARIDRHEGDLEHVCSPQRWTHRGRRGARVRRYV